VKVEQENLGVGKGKTAKLEGKIGKKKKGGGEKKLFKFIYTKFFGGKILCDNLHPPSNTIFSSKQNRD
jgi:hypothetical protein